DVGRPRGSSWPPADADGGAGEAEGEPPDGEAKDGDRPESESGHEDAADDRDRPLVCGAVRRRRLMEGAGDRVEVHRETFPGRRPALPKPGSPSGKASRSLGMRSTTSTGIGGQALAIPVVWSCGRPRRFSACKERRLLAFSRPWTLRVDGRDLSFAIRPTSMPGNDGRELEGGG